MSKRTKKRIGRPPGAPYRPVLSARVPEALYATLTASARAAGRTLGEELIGRVQRSFEWEQQFGEARAVLAEAKKTAAQVTKTNLEAGLKQGDYQQVRVIGGSAWLEKGVDPTNFTTDKLDPVVLEELLTRAAERGAKLALEGDQSWARAAKAALEGEKS
jgi:hypothetical protein